MKHDRHHIQWWKANYSLFKILNKDVHFHKDDQYCTMDYTDSYKILKLKYVILKDKTAFVHRQNHGSI